MCVRSVCGVPVQVLFAEEDPHCVVPGGIRQKAARRAAPCTSTGGTARKGWINFLGPSRADSRLSRNPVSSLRCTRRVKSGTISIHTLCANNAGGFLVRGYQSLSDEVLRRRTAFQKNTTRDGRTCWQADMLCASCLSEWRLLLVDTSKFAAHFYPTGCSTD